jgi:Transposase and inactivated derivatives
MPKVYSEDLRRRVLAAYETTNATYEEVAARFGVSVGFVRKLRELYKETGGITRRSHGGGMPRTAQTTRRPFVVGAKSSLI